MDPISAFAAAQTALAMIRKGVDFYKECKKAQADVTDITIEVTGWIGKFMDHKEVVSEAARKTQAESEIPPEPGKPSTLNSQALNNVMMQIQLENAETELREMLVYQTPGLGAVWTRFEKERQRLTEVHRQHREAQEQHQQELRREAAVRAKARRRRLRKIWEEIHWAIMVITIASFYAGCIYLIVKDRAEQYPALGTCVIPRGSPGFEWYSNLRWINCDK